MAKLTALNFDYMRVANNQRLTDLITPLLRQSLGDRFNEQGLVWLTAGMDGLKDRAKTVLELADNAGFYVHSLPFSYDEKAAKLINKGNARELLSTFVDAAKKIMDWTQPALESCAKTVAEQQEVGLGKVAQPIRVALTGTTVSPSVFEVMAVLGREETLRRLTTPPAESAD